MLKYLQEIKDRLINLKNGMTKNADKWTAPDETPDIVQGLIDEIDSASTAIDTAKENLNIAQVSARKLATSTTQIADLLENSAIAYEKSDADKLSLYGIELRKEKKRKPAPSTVLQMALADDTDGVGFIVSVNADADADQYEWFRGIGADPTKTDIIPELKLYKTTTKISFVDDEVEKGVRYFYKVRAVNAAGEGPFSEPVSRVQ